MKLFFALLITDSPRSGIMLRDMFDVGQKHLIEMLQIDLMAHHYSPLF